MDTKVAWMHK